MASEPGLSSGPGCQKLADMKRPVRNSVAKLRGWGMFNHHANSNLVLTRQNCMPGLAAHCAVEKPLPQTGGCQHWGYLWAFLSTLGISVGMFPNIPWGLGSRVSKACRPREFLDVGRAGRRRVRNLYDIVADFLLCKKPRMLHSTLRYLEYTMGIL